jgi:PKD repeat protein
LYEASDDNNGDSELSIDGLDYETNLFEGQNMEFEVILSNLGDEGCVVDWDMGDGNSYPNSYKVHHKYEDNGLYQVAIHAYNDDTSVNASFEIYVKNIPPKILTVMFDEVINEGTISSFNIQYDDVPTDNVTVTWSFPDEILEGDFVQYKFANDGEFVITVTVEDEDGGATTEQKMIKVQNVAPEFTEFDVPTEGGDPGVALEFVVFATDPGENDVITYTFDFGDGTAKLLSQTGNTTHKFKDGDSFDVVICAIDEDGGETCRTIPIPIALLEQLEDSGLPGFGFLGVISALGAVTLLRRRTH